MESVVILGAGFSSVAGLPQTRDLFRGSELPDSRSDSARLADKNVLACFRNWAESNNSLDAEEWLLELYEQKDNAVLSMMHGVTWDDAVRFALRKLVPIPKGKNMPWYYGICNYKCHPVHKRFWKKIREEVHCKNIVSMNYDILVEQALHKDTGPHRSAPQCCYGGIPLPQAVRVMKDVTGKTTKKKEEREKLEQLGEDFVLYKLHGSVNFAREKHRRNLKHHSDVRAVYRHGKSVGSPEIIPPIPEKEMPPEFSQIWLEAEQALGACDNWIICGYSLPLYDYALRKFFKRILQAKKHTQIIILDPNSEKLESRWRDLSPKNVVTKALLGIPESFSDDWSMC